MNTLMIYFKCQVKLTDYVIVQNDSSVYLSHSNNNVITSMFVVSVQTFKLFNRHNKFYVNANSSFFKLRQMLRIVAWTFYVWLSQNWMKMSNQIKTIDSMAYFLIRFGYDHWLTQRVNVTISFGLWYFY